MYEQDIAFSMGDMIHYALPVGELLRGSVSDRSCVMCGFVPETLHNVFWECVAAKSFWFRILRLLGRKYRSANFTWGVVFWGMLDQQMVFIIIIILPCLYM